MIATAMDGARIFEALADVRRAERVISGPWNARASLKLDVVTIRFEMLRERVRAAA